MRNEGALKKYWIKLYRNAWKWLLVTYQMTVAFSTEFLKSYCSPNIRCVQLSKCRSLLQFNINQFVKVSSYLPSSLNVRRSFPLSHICLFHESRAFLASKQRNTIRGRLEQKWQFTKAQVSWRELALSLQTFHTSSFIMFQTLSPNLSRARIRNLPIFSQNICFITVQTGLAVIL